MKIVIDMQGVQGRNKKSEVRNELLLFAKFIVLNRRKHDVVLVLSDQFPETISSIRLEFKGILSKDKIKVWHSVNPISEQQSFNKSRNEVALLIRESFIKSLNPDVVHITGFLDGYFDDSVVNVLKKNLNTVSSVSVHDLKIDLINNEEQKKYDLFLNEKIKKLNCADMCFCTSISLLEQFSSILFEPECQLINLRVKPDDQDKPNYYDEDLAIDWNVIANNAILFWEKSHCKKKSILKTKKSKKKLALVSPMPPEKTGIADYSADLLIALSEYYDIYVIQENRDNIDFNLPSNCEVHDQSWLRSNKNMIDRVLYHIGNSHYHKHMLSLSNEIPGVIVLHDFFLSSLTASIELNSIDPKAWIECLYNSHGYSSLRDNFNSEINVKNIYPTNWPFLKNAKGVIVHSIYAKELANKWYGSKVSNRFEVVPLLRSESKKINSRSARQKMGFNENDFIVCSFGFLGETKLSHVLLESWINTELAKDTKCHLIFVGENPKSQYGLGILKTIESSPYKKRIKITGYISSDDYIHYLSAADLSVQLRTDSRGETSAAILDCMNYSLPLIINSNGSAGEIQDDMAYKLPDKLSNKELIKALEECWKNIELRKRLSKTAKENVRMNNQPNICAAKYSEIIENFYSKNNNLEIINGLINSINKNEKIELSLYDLFNLSNSISKTFPEPKSSKRIFLDITATQRHDLKSGIERVVRAILLSLINNSPNGYRVEPIYLSTVNNTLKYFLAHNYTLEVLECPKCLSDKIVEPEFDDIILILDISGEVLINAERSGLFRDYKNRGVEIYSIVYDLLPIKLPDVFPYGADKQHASWIKSISKCDGVICISKTVENDFKSWFSATEQENEIRISNFNLGADLFNSSPTKGMPENSNEKLSIFKKNHTFLMVGTIEPRKGYLEVINTFSSLWENGLEINLVIVGREGWIGLPEFERRNIPETINLLSSHPQRNQRLFWFNGISDEFLDCIYRSSTCLIAASYDEGFGLPLIEAAKHNLPIIARDIPIFREVAGDSAYYFNADNPNSISDIIKEWLILYSKDRVPDSSGIPWITWEESTKQLIDSIFVNVS